MKFGDYIPYCTEWLCVVRVVRQYMQSDAVLKSSLVENATQAMMSEQEEYNQRRCRLVQSLAYVRRFDTALVHADRGWFKKGRGGHGPQSEAGHHCPPVKFY